MKRLFILLNIVFICQPLYSFEIPEGISQFIEKYASECKIATSYDYSPDEYKEFDKLDKEFPPYYFQCDINNDSLEEYFIIIFCHSELGKGYRVEQRLITLSKSGGKFKVELDTVLGGGESLKYKSSGGFSLAFSRIEPTLIEVTTDSKYVKEKILERFKIDYPSIRMEFSLIGEGLVYFDGKKIKYKQIKYNDI